MEKLVAAGALLFAAVALAPQASADLPSGVDHPWCSTMPTGSFIDQQGFKTICDGPLNADGSWMRKRSLWGWSPRLCTQTGSGIFNHRHCIDQDVPIHVYSSEEYQVMPDAIPFGEPGYQPGYPPGYAG